MSIGIDSNVVCCSLMRDYFDVRKMETASKSVDRSESPEDMDTEE